MTKIDKIEFELLNLHKKMDAMLNLSSKKIIKQNFYYCLDNWFAKIKAPNLCAGSIRSLRNVVRLLKAYISDKEVYKLLPIDFELCFARLPANKTRKDLFIYSREFLKFAYFNKFIAEDISIYLKAVKYKAKEGTAYSQEQILMILNNVSNSNVLALFRFYYLTGVRRSEALNLCWQDIDFKNNLIHIKGTKTFSSDRLIPLTKQLNELFNNMNMNDINSRVFRVSESGIRWQIERLKKILPFNVNIKNFRTTFATRCADIGISPKIVQSWLGHTDIRTTNKYYIKSTPCLNSQEVALFNERY